MTTLSTDFRSRVEAYQKEGNRAIIDEIIRAVEINFMDNPTRRRYDDGIGSSGRISIVLDRDEHYIAYRVRRTRELIMRRYEGRITDVFTDELNRLLSIIQIELRIDVKAEIYKTDEWLNYYTMTPEMFADLEKKMPEIEDKMHTDDFYEFNILFRRYKEIIDLRVIERAEAIPKIAQSIIVALEHGLKYVDTTKSEREMVKYINIAFSSKFGDLELERNGLTRIQRINNQGNRKNMFVKKHFPEDLTKVVFGATVNDFHGKLTKSNSDFVGEVLEIVLADALSGNIGAYTCDKRSGEARVRKSHIAEKTGLSPATVRQKLSRISKILF